jgi:hypothetical protein
MTRPIEIVIDELVVRGLDPWQARTAAAALEARLETLAATSGAHAVPRAEAFRRLQPVEAPAGSPDALGDAVAGAVWGALSPGGTP